MQDQLAPIIKRRIRGAQAGLFIVVAVSCYFIFTNPDSGKYVIIVLAIIAPYLLFLMIANKANYPNLKPWYRTFNKWVYLYGGRLLFFTSIFSLFSDSRKLNPFQDLYGEHGPAVSETVGNMAGDALGAYVGHRVINSAKDVEALYAHQEQNPAPSPVAPSPPPLPPTTTPPTK